MRNLGILGAIFGAALLAGLFAAGQAGAENRTFIIPNNADGYGIDRCLANGERCGQAVATNYCQSQQFALAKSFRRIERDEITGAVPVSTNNTCAGGSCDNFVAIICSR
jgi:hypothetical protein